MNRNDKGVNRGRDCRTSDILVDRVETRMLKPCSESQGEWIDVDSVNAHSGLQQVARVTKGASADIERTTVPERHLLKGLNHKRVRLAVQSERSIRSLPVYQRFHG
jgi:hypothetical protein